MPASKSALRKLEGISYWVIEDPDGISDFINEHVRIEWEVDVKNAGRSITEDPWLATLQEREWTLKIVSANEVRLDPVIMEYKDSAKGYVFAESLAKRTKEMRRAIETYRMVIWPIIVAGEGFMLADGYCRYTTLTELGVSRIYSYVGTLGRSVTPQSASKQYSRSS